MNSSVMMEILVWVWLISSAGDVPVNTIAPLGQIQFWLLCLDKEPLNWRAIKCMECITDWMYNCMDSFSSFYSSLWQRSSGGKFTVYIEKSNGKEELCMLSTFTHELFTNVILAYVIVMVSAGFFEYPVYASQVCRTLRKYGFRRWCIHER